MAGGKCNPDRGGDGDGRGRRYIQNQPNRGRGRYRDAPERGFPGRRPPVHMNQPPPPQPGGGAGSAAAAAAPPPDQPLPRGNEGWIQVRGGCGGGLPEFCLSISLKWCSRFLISFSSSLGE